MHNQAKPGCYFKTQIAFIRSGSRKFVILKQAVPERTACFIHILYNDNRRKDQSLGDTYI